MYHSGVYSIADQAVRKLYFSSGSTFLHTYFKFYVESLKS